VLHRLRSHRRREDHSPGAALAAAIEDALAGRLAVDLAGARRYAECFTAKRVADHYARVYARLLPQLELRCSEAKAA
jgi:hypothetical protein